MPMRIAHRIAANRVVAGVHYPVDSMGGAVLGAAIADAILELSGATPIGKRSFDGSTFVTSADQDATPANISAAVAVPEGDAPEGPADDSCPLFKDLLEQVKGEWAVWSEAPAS